MDCILSLKVTDNKVPAGPFAKLSCKKEEYELLQAQLAGTQIEIFPAPEKKAQKNPTKKPASKKKAPAK